MRLLVTLAGLEPGAPLDAAVRLADALDARRVGLTLLAGPRPHPEVAAWVRARRRVGDAVLLHGAGVSFRRLPSHEAGLRLAGALRAAEATGLAVDGFAAPGWACSPGARRALADAGLDLLVDDGGVHRLGPDGTPFASWHGGPSRVTTTAGAAAEGRGPTIPQPSGSLRSRLPRLARAERRRQHPAGLTHLAVTTAAPFAVDLVDRALDAGAETTVAAALAAPGSPRARAAAPHDPERWSMTA